MNSFRSLFGNELISDIICAKLNLHDKANLYCSLTPIACEQTQIKIFDILNSYETICNIYKNNEANKCRHLKENARCVMCKRFSCASYCLKFKVLKIHPFLS